MAKLLLVEGAVPATGLRVALGGAGHEVARAPGGSFALTMLERNRPDAIVSAESLGDMRGDELCAIVRSDPATREIPFVLLGDGNASFAQQATAAGVDLVVGAEVPIPSVVMRIQRVLAEHHHGGERAPDSRREGATPPRAPWLPTRPPMPASTERGAMRRPGERAPLVGPGPPPLAGTQERGAMVRADARAPLLPPAKALTLQGSLAVMELADLLQALARARKTGRVEVSLADGAGVFVLDTGRVVHAHYADRSGEPAVAVMMAQSEAGGTFAFAPLARDEVEAEPRTIHATVERLLLEVAAQIDESRVATERAATAPPASAEKG